MHAWTPPKGSKVILSIGRLTDVPGSVLRRGDPDKWLDAPRRAFCKKFGFKYTRSGFETIPLSNPRWPEILDWIDDSTERGEAGLRSKKGGHGNWWLEPPAPRATEESSWFPLSAGRSTLRSPGRPPRGRSFLRRAIGKSDWGHLEIVSDEFRGVVVGAGLTGLCFLPLEGWGDWWQVWATEPLGRGLDHPLVDPAKLVTRADPDRPILAPRRRGEECAWVKYLRKGVRIDDPTVERLVALGDDEWCRIHGPRRFVQEHLPETDFAYSEWIHEKDEPLAWFGRRSRDVCCNQRARKVLVDAGVMKPAHFGTPLVVIAAAESDAEVLDDAVGHPLPLPVFTPAEAAAERERRESSTAGGSNRGASAPAGLDSIAALLEKRLGDGTATWVPLRDHAKHLKRFRAASAFQSLPDSLKSLAELLPVEVEVWSGDEDDDPEFEFELGTPELATWVDEEEVESPEGPRPDDVVFASTGGGDWFAVGSNDPNLPGDAKVTWWDHETYAPHDEWPSVASFVQFLIEMCDKE